MVGWGNIVGLGLAVLGLSACTHAPKAPEGQLERVAPPAALHDAAGYENLHSGLKAHIEALKKLAPQDTKMAFGRRQIPVHKYVKSLSYLLTLIPKSSSKGGSLNQNNVPNAPPKGLSLAGVLEEQKKNQTEDLFIKALHEKFEFYAVPGGEPSELASVEPAYVKVTGYYTPLLRGAREPSFRFSQPLYRRPKGLVHLRFARWCGQFESLKNKVDCSRLWRGRVNDEQQFVPYYTRAQMYEPLMWKRVAHRLQTQKRRPAQTGVWPWDAEEGADLALVWLDPVDAFFLEIQGSGRVKLQDGEELDVGYVDQNGHPYRAIGRDLLDKIPLEKMSLQSLQAYLRGLKPRARQKILNKNKSVVFFQILQKGPQTAMGTRAVGGRSVAVDDRFFPRGGFGFLYYQKPVWQTPVQPSKPVHS